MRPFEFIRRPSNYFVDGVGCLEEPVACRPVAPGKALRHQQLVKRCRSYGNLDVPALYELAACSSLPIEADRQIAGNHCGGKWGSSMSTVSDVMMVSVAVPTNWSLGKQK